MKRAEMITVFAQEMRRAKVRQARIMRVHGAFSEQFNESFGITQGIAKAAFAFGIMRSEIEEEAAK